MYENLKMLLLSLGFETAQSDEWLLNWSLDCAQKRILENTNQPVLPKALEVTAVEMAASEFLLMKKQSGQLSEVSLEPVAKQISEGDTSVTFAIGEGDMTPEQRLDKLIQHLQAHSREELTCHRRLSW